MKVWVTVQLDLEDDADPKEVVENMNYLFAHRQIQDTEIVGVTLDKKGDSAE